MLCCSVYTQGVILRIHLNSLILFYRILLQTFVPETALYKCYAQAVVKVVFLNYGNWIQANHQPLLDACAMRSHRVNTHAYFSLTQATHTHMLAVSSTHRHLCGVGITRFLTELIRPLLAPFICVIIFPLNAISVSFPFSQLWPDQS